MMKHFLPDRESILPMSIDRPFHIQAGFARIAEALADPVREAMVAALADGRALPAGELAATAGVSAQSASAHLQKLLDAGVLSVWTQGRFRYYRIADEEVAALIESLANLAARSGNPSRKGHRIAPELCAARSCYHHLAGRLGVALAQAFTRGGYVRIRDGAGELTKRGRTWCRENDIDLVPARDTAAIRLCLDWSERLPHLAGPFPTAVFHHLLARGHLVRRDHHRALRLTEKGRAFFNQFGIDTSV
jgi:DNA-binding transcriptional ArsR family regulator